MIKTYLLEFSKDIKIYIFWKKREYKKWDRVLVQKPDYFSLLKYWAKLVWEKTFTEKDVKATKKIDTSEDNTEESNIEENNNNDEIDTSEDNTEESKGFLWGVFWKKKKK